MHLIQEQHFSFTQCKHLHCHGPCVCPASPVRQHVFLFWFLVSLSHSLLSSLCLGGAHCSPHTCSSDAPVAYYPAFLGHYLRRWLLIAGLLFGSTTVVAQLSASLVLFLMFLCFCSSFVCLYIDFVDTSCNPHPWFLSMSVWQCGVAC